MPFEPPGSCSFATRRSGPLALWRQQSAELIGGIAMKNARRIAGCSRFPRAAISFGPREQEVLDWMAEGKSYTDIGDILGMRHDTVKSHAKSILRKIGVVDRSRAAVLAAAWGLTFPDLSTHPGR